MKKGKYFILFLLVLSNACISQKKMITVYEQKDINLFNDFKNYLVSAIHKNEDMGDTTHLKYVVLNYLVTDRQLDSSHEGIINYKLTADQLKNLKNELNTFYNFLGEYEKEHLAGNLTLTPIRLSSDTFIYNRLTKVQKENTFVFYDEHLPGKTLGYVLFINPFKNVFDKPRIWSWTLIFKFGKFGFKSVTGEEGYEYFFSPRQFNR